VGPSVTAAVLCGCVAGLPPPQVGCLPRPGFFTFFKLARTEELFPLSTAGSHGRRVPVQGIIYTTRVGFLDLAHVYNTILLADDASKRVAIALDEGLHTVPLQQFDDSRVWVTLPASAADIDRKAAVDRDRRSTARAIGECVGYQLMAWHEIITWFEYRTTRFWTEKPSSFTYEDIVSNDVGVLVYDRISGELSVASLSGSLRQVLGSLGLVEKSVAAHAIKLEKGHWWGARLYTRRLVDTGTAEGFITPWLVPGLGGDPSVDIAKPLSVPCQEEGTGYSVWISPSMELRRKFEEAMPFVPAEIEARADFPFMVEVVRNLVRSELGEASTGPD
jgi:Protein of unknown function (DUF4056)